MSVEALLDVLKHCILDVISQLAKYEQMKFKTSFELPFYGGYSRLHLTNRHLTNNR